GVERAGQVGAPDPQQGEHPGDRLVRAGVMGDLAVDTAPGARPAVVPGTDAAALDLYGADAPALVSSQLLRDGQRGAPHVDSSPLSRCPSYASAVGSGSTSEMSSSSTPSGASVIAPSEGCSAVEVSSGRRPLRAW